VAGLGTGGTMSGAGRFLKEQKPGLRNVGVDPVGSVYQGYFQTGKLPEPHVYKVEGIGEDMLCKALDFSVLDEVRQVDDQQCFSAARRLARDEGIFAGGSSGGAVHVAVEVAKELGRGKNIVVVLTDTGNSYISKFYSDEWMRDNGFVVDEKGPGRVGDLIRERQPTVYFARKGQHIDEVVDAMRRHGIQDAAVSGPHRLAGRTPSGRGQPRGQPLGAPRRLLPGQRRGGEGARTGGGHHHQNRPHRVPRGADVRVVQRLKGYS
jgi:cystathionine beta-synthase